MAVVTSAEPSSPLLYYIRHGETDWNAQGRVQGNQDIPLNELGRAQAVHAGSVLLELMTRAGHDPSDYDYVASPLSRASVTMELVRVKIGLPATGYRTDARLRELSYGNWEGMNLSQMQSDNPDLFAARAFDTWNVAPPAGETYAHVSARLKDWYDGLTMNTVVVAHGGCMRALRVALGLAEPAEAVNFSVGQGVVYVFDGSSMTAYS